VRLPDKGDALEQLFGFVRVVVRGVGNEGKAMSFL
jgi:hypothetical protein